MPMRLPYVTERDESLPHQVVFLAINATVYVSCNCRVEYHGPGKTKSHAPMGVSENLETARKFYNDPAMHRTEFGEEDTAKW